MAKPRVFISHSARDDDRARSLLTQLHQRLSDEEFEILLDWKGLEVGDKWEHKIGTWLDRCHAAIVLFTAKALASDYVKYEVSNLLHRRRDAPGGPDAFPLLPILVEPLTEAQLSAFYGPINLWEIQRYGPADDAAVLQVVVEKLEPLKAALATTTVDDALEGHVAAILGKTDPDFLIDVAVRIGIDNKNWKAADAARRMAAALVSSTLPIIGRAISELRPRLGADRTRELFDLLMPCWVSSEAARALETVTQAAPRQRYALLNAQAARFTPQMYLRRAKAQVREFAGSVVNVRTDAMGINVETELLTRIKRALEDGLNVNDPTLEIPMSLGDALLHLEQNREPLVVSLKTDPTLLPEFFAVAQAAEFAGVTFLALIDLPATDPEVAKISVLPPLPKDLETFAYRQHLDYEKKLSL